LRKLLYILLVVFSSAVMANSEIIEINSEKEKTAVLDVHNSIEKMTTNVKRCMAEPGGTRQICGCLDLEGCKFKEDYKQLIDSYCKLKSQYPEWHGKTIHMHQNSETIALGMLGLDRQLGNACK